MELPFSWKAQLLQPCLKRAGLRGPGGGSGAAARLVLSSQGCLQKWPSLECASRGRASYWAFWPNCAGAHVVGCWAECLVCRLLSTCLLANHYQAVVDPVQLPVFCPLVTSIPFLAASKHLSSQAGRALQTRLLASVHECYWHLVFADNGAHIFAGSISCV